MQLSECSGVRLLLVGIVLSTLATGGGCASAGARPGSQQGEYAELTAERLLLTGRLRLAERDFSAAREVCEAALKSESLHIRGAGLSLRARVALAEGRAGLAEQDLETAFDLIGPTSTSTDLDKLHATLLGQRAQLHWNGGRVTDAIEDLDKERVLREELLITEKGKAERARESSRPWEKAVLRIHRDHEPEELPKTQRLFKMVRPTVAQAQRSLKRCSANLAAACFARGDKRLRAGKTDDAIADLERARSLAPWLSSRAAGSLAIAYEKRVRERVQRYDLTGAEEALGKLKELNYSFCTNCEED